MSLNPEANGLLCHAITQPKLFIRPLASAIQSHGLIDLGFGHFAVGMLVATQKRFRMCVRAISLASRCVFRLRMSSMSYPSRQSFRVCYIPGTSFSGTILHVVKLCSKPEMSRVDTCRSITRVQHKHSFVWPRACMEKPADDVRAYRLFALRRYFAHAAVSTAKQSACPQPTVIRASNGNFRPEFLSKREARACQHRTGVRAIFYPCLL